MAAHALRRFARDPSKLRISVLHQEDYGFFGEREGQPYLRNGDHYRWRNDDLQSFTPLRFMPPELMGFVGRALVIDPDVFALGDVGDLFAMDMAGKSLFCVPRPGHHGRERYKASSVMLLDCARLRHWRCEAQFAELFDDRRDYLLWIDLELEPDASIGYLGAEWNHFDTLTPATRFLHNTNRITQPWKKGLPIDYAVSGGKAGGVLFFPAAREAYRRLRQKSRYKAHPDARQTDLFFALLRETVEAGIVDTAWLRGEMEASHLRADALDMLARAPSVESVLARVRSGVAIEAAPASRAGAWAR